MKQSKDKVKKVELELSDYALALYEKVPKELRVKAIEAGLLMLARDEVLCQTFFNKENLKDEVNAVNAKNQVAFPF